MKKIRLFALFLIFCVVLYPLSAYGQSVMVTTMLDKLTRPSTTSLQVLNLVEQYKGQTVKGQGKVKDILKSFGDENKAMVYINKPYRGKQYEILLVVDEGTVEKIKKGKGVWFEGKFATMTFRTLRFENAEVKPKPWWWPF